MKKQIKSRAEVATVVFLFLFFAGAVSVKAQEQTHNLEKELDKIEETITGKIKNLFVENKKLRAQYDATVEGKRTLKEQVEKTRVENQRLQGELNTREQAAEKTAGRLKETELANAELGKKLEGVAARNKGLEEEKAVLAKDAGKLKGEYTQSEKKISELAEQVEKTRVENQRLLGELNTREQAAEKTAGRLKETELANAELGKKLEGLAARNKGLEEKKDDIQKHFLDLQKTNQQEKVQLNGTITEMKKKIGAYEILSPINSKFDTKAKDKVSVYLAFGYLYSLEENLNEAIRYYNKVLAISPDEKESKYNLGYLYTQKGQYKKAVMVYEQALQGDGTDKEIYFNLSLIFAKYLKNDIMSSYYFDKYANS
ncbi:MAG: tetratricopeptide repeat protein [Candidatus Omnitrophota bacterium]